MSSAAFPPSAGAMFPGKQSANCEFALERVAQDFVDTLTGHRACQWEAGDVARGALAAQPNAVMRRRVVNHLASMGHCTSQYVGQLATVADAFDTTLRKPDLSWAWYRAVLAAARRTGRSVVSVFYEATAANWHVPQLAALGKPAAAVLTLLELDDTCPGCNCELHVSIAPSDCIQAGHPVSCPICGTGEHGVIVGALA